MNNPEVTRFVNDGLRPLSDLLGAAYYRAKNVLASYDATGMSTKLGNDPTFSDVIAGDGAATDGRPQLTCGGCKLTIENLRALVTQLETVDAGTGLTLIQGILSISPRYQG